MLPMMITFGPDRKLCVAAALRMRPMPPMPLSTISVGGRTPACSARLRKRA